jgi:hypothetical protein
MKKSTRFNYKSENNKNKHKVDYKLMAILLILVLVFIFNKILFNSSKIKIDKHSDDKSQYEDLLVKSLSRLEYGSNFQNNSRRLVLFISDTEGNKIFVATLNGRILYEIGSGKKGLRNGDFNKSEFCAPRGLAYRNNNLYVADTCNNAIRKIDFEKQEVSSLIKDDALLREVMDIKFFPDDENLIISGINKFGLNFYDLENDELKSIMKESIEDKIIVKLFRYDNKLYFLDKMQNAVFVLDKDNNIEEFLKIDFDKIKADSFHLDDTGIYVLDKDAGQLFKMDLKKKKEWQIYNEKRFVDDTDNILNAEFNFPSDILAIKDRFYIADTGNHRIAEINRNKNRASSINICPNFQSKGLNGLSGYLYDTDFKNQIRFSYDKKGKILLDMRDDFKFTENAPSSLYIFEQNHNNAILIKSYSFDEIASKNLILPKLKKDTIYYIQGRFYYSQTGEITPCLIKHFNKKIISNKKKTENHLTIKF